MRASKAHMDKVKSTILDAAGKGFREEGYGGLGINGLSKRAGLTSGAFYGHFSSKSEAFQEVVEKGLHEYADTIKHLIDEYGDSWPQHFLDYYLGKQHVGDLACSCAVPGLSADVMRADDAIKQTYSSESLQIATNIATGLKRKDTQDAWALMALLAGAVMMARSVADPDQSKEILDATRHWADKIVAQQK